MLFFLKKKWLQHSLICDVNSKKHEMILIFLKFIMSLMSSAQKINKEIVGYHHRVATKQAHFQEIIMSS